MVQESFLLILVETVGLSSNGPTDVTRGRVSICLSVRLRPGSQPLRRPTPTEKWSCDFTTLNRIPDFLYKIPLVRTTLICLVVRKGRD